MFGILNINKPAGCTSRDVVNRVQRLVRPAKVGHAGTLDPLATGVLVVCVGPATRLVEYVQRMPKRYVGTFRLGVTSPSDDTELAVTPLDHPSIPTGEQIDKARHDFLGEIDQRPPAYSAIKIQGQKAYDLARQGKPVELATRCVTIHSIDIVRYDYPELVLDITCGSGTYIRSLGRDLAMLLGSGAVMSGLQRTAIGGFTVDSACTIEAILEQGVEAHLQSPVQAVADLPCAPLSCGQVEEITHGRNIECVGDDGDELVALDERGTLVAILVPRGENLWGPRMVFKRSADPD